MHAVGHLKISAKWWDGSIFLGDGPIKKIEVFLSLLSTSIFLSLFSESIQENKPKNIWLGEIEISACERLFLQQKSRVLLRVGNGEE
jgi:hypothetical protein